MTISIIRSMNKESDEQMKMSRRSRRLQKVAPVSYNERRVNPLPKHKRTSKDSKEERIIAKALANTPIPDGWKLGPKDPKVG